MGRSVSFPDASGRREGAAARLVARLTVLLFALSLGAASAAAQTAAPRRPNRPRRRKIPTS